MLSRLLRAEYINALKKIPLIVDYFYSRSFNMPDVQKIYKRIDALDFDHTNDETLIELLNALKAALSSDTLLNEDGDTPLISAVMDREEELVEFLLSMGVNPNKKDKDGRAALYFAAITRHETIGKQLCLVENLINAGADVNATDALGKTPLMIAASYPYTPVVRLLLERRADPNKRDDEKKTALDHLLAHYRYYKDAIELQWRNDLYFTIGQAAAAEGSMDVAVLLIQYDAKVSIYAFSSISECSKNAEGTKGIECQRLEILFKRRARDPEFIESCLRINTLIKIIEAIIFPDLFEFILKKIGPSDAMQNLKMQYKAIHLDVTEEKLSQFIQQLTGLMRDARDNESNTLLHFARHCYDVSRFMYAGIDINALNNHQATPIISVLSHYPDEERDTAAKSLLSLGADIHLVDENNKSSLHYAMHHAAFRSAVVTKLLIKKGVNVNQVDNEGNTALHDLILQCCIEKGEVGNFRELAVMKLLIKHDADINKENKQGHSPLKCAMHKNEKNMVQLLLESGAKQNDLQSIVENPTENQPREGTLSRFSAVTQALFFWKNRRDVHPQNKSNHQISPFRQ